MVTPSRASPTWEISASSVGVSTLSGVVGMSACRWKESSGVASRQAFSVAPDDAAPSAGSRIVIVPSASANSYPWDSTSAQKSSSRA